ncbi:hypothetical protein VQ643_13210 [Pseudomonas sp. F1_0610]|uniref:hypothetical protein n=1 Tax=Pseudomonas sp. F1_0610 TaxID=3114284 RepID=UPI0039C1FCDA
MQLNNLLKIRPKVLIYGFIIPCILIILVFLFIYNTFFCDYRGLAITSHTYSTMNIISKNLDEAINNKKNPITTELIEQFNIKHVDKVEINSFNRNNKTYWFITATFNGKSDALLQGTQLVFFRENTPATTSLEYSVETLTPPNATKPRAQENFWHCRFYIADKQKLIKQTYRNCAAVLEQFESTDQLFVKDSKGNVLTK